MICVRCAFVGLLLTSSIVVAGSWPPTSQELSDSALIAASGTTSIEMARDSVVRATQILATRASHRPNDLASASIVFSEPVYSEGLDKLSSEYKLEVARVDIKVPDHVSKTVYTFSIGAADIVRREGPLVNRLNREIGRIRAKFASRAEKAIDPEEKARLDAIALGPMPFYRAEVIGSLADLLGSSSAKHVRVVLVDEGSSRIEEYQYTSARSPRQPLPSGIGLRQPGSR
jgi:hypothetical protein